MGRGSLTVTVLGGVGGGALFCFDAEVILKLTEGRREKEGQLTRSPASFLDAGFFARNGRRKLLVATVYTTNRQPATLPVLFGEGRRTNLAIAFATPISSTFVLVAGAGPANSQSVVFLLPL